MRRRGFLAAAGAFVVALSVDGQLALAAPGKLDAPSPDLFIAIEPDGTVRLVCHRSEMGQHVLTSMAQLLAEELEVEWDRIEVVRADGDAKYGDQNTDGSRSVRRNFDRLRRAGAAMRVMLERAAAGRWKVSPSSVRAQAGTIVHDGSERVLDYGALAADAAKQPMPSGRALTLKPRKDWRFIAKPMPARSVPEVIRGRGQFAMDVQLPGMVVATIARPPTVLGTVASFDDTAALKVPGVLQTAKLPELPTPVLFHPLGGVAVIARDTWSAILGREALKVEWNPGPNAVYDSEAFAETLREQVRKKGDVKRDRGDADEALEKAAKTVRAEYYVPHLAHSSMEPPCAVARWDGDRVECWACVQTPQRARSEVAQACGVPEADVTVHVTLLGGGFGRKSKPDFVVEAALLAREVGKPVKVVWTREDDLRHGYYHTVSAQQLDAGLDEAGTCTAWRHRTAFPTIGSTFTAGLTEPRGGDLDQGAIDTPFDVPNLRLETGRAPAHLRIGWLRSVANIYHAFAVQSFVAEVAHAAGRDPLEVLLELIGPARRVDPSKDGAKYGNYGDSLRDHPIDTGRLAATAKEAGAMAKWGRSLPAGHGLGIAVHRSFNTYVATVIEAALDDDGRLSIPGIWSVMDAGTVVNPNHAASQLEGGTLFGLSNALYGSITAKSGAVVQGNFPQWRVMRMNEAPRTMETKIIESDAPPAGVGEPPTPPAAPALANAIFAASGIRVRTLPVFGTDRHDRLVRDAQEAAQ